MGDKLVRTSVNNGGDIALYLAEGAFFDIGIADDRDTHLSDFAMAASGGGHILFMAGSGCIMMTASGALRQAVGGDEACRLGLQIRLPCWHRMRLLRMLLPV